MLEDVISKLDTKGLMVLTVLIGKRMLELLKDETKDMSKDVESKDSKNAKVILSNITTTPLILPHA